MMQASEAADPTQGLCAACVHGPYCERCRDEGIFYCDNFQDVSASVQAYPTMGVHKPEEPTSGEERLMGLCVSCERRGYCTNARKLGGVWVCDEYL